MQWLEIQLTPQANVKNTVSQMCNSLGLSLEGSFGIQDVVPDKGIYSVRVHQVLDATKINAAINENSDLLGIRVVSDFIIDT